MSEKSEAKRDRARLTKNSGRGQYQKADALLDIFTVDYKEYEKSFSVSRDVWAKVCTDAMRNNQTEPALKVILGSGNEKVRLWIVAEHIMEDYIRLRKMEDEHYENHW